MPQRPSPLLLSCPPVVHLFPFKLYVECFPGSLPLTTWLYCTSICMNRSIYRDIRPLTSVQKWDISFMSILLCFARYIIWNIQRTNFLINAYIWLNNFLSNFYLHFPWFVRVTLKKFFKLSCSLYFVPMSPWLDCEIWKDQCCSLNKYYKTQ